MPLFSLSPSVTVKETDLTLIVPAVATSIGGFVGRSQWGPVEEATTVASESALVSIFGQPNQDTATDFLTAANFLSYSNNLKFVRVIGTLATNAYTGGSTAPVIKNDVDRQNKVSGLTDVKYIAKYPGVLGNSIKVSVADSATYGAWEYRSLFGAAITVSKAVTTTSASAVLAFGGAVTTSNLSAGMEVTGVGIPVDTTILSIDSSTQVTLSAPATADGSVTVVFVTYTGAPGTSSYVDAKAGENDEIHVVIVDALGEWTGTAGTVLEKFTALSKAVDAKDFSGASSYYADVLNRGSKFVWFGGTHEVVGWGGSSTSTFTSLSAQTDYTLAEGVDDNDTGITTGIVNSGYALLARPEEIDVNLIIGPTFTTSADQVISAKYVIENVAEIRKDCVAFISPPQEAVVNNPGNEVQGILAFRNLVGSSSYAVMDSGWKLTYDRFNDQVRWIPLCSDVAGACAFTDAVTDPWFSPGGFNRGNIKNVIKLAYNPGTQAERDTLYLNNINPVASFPGEGVVLFGDKTLQTKPSAFDRINVRRLFIVLEKAISTAAKYQLFEFNDSFTRARFVGMITPYLREIQGRRGVTDFRIVCDTTNNTGEIIDSNGFVADIYIKPPRSINFIELNFIATPTGVNFDEIA